jgi:hypothetical protein
MNTKDTINLIASYIIRSDEEENNEGGQSVMT